MRRPSARWRPVVSLLLLASLVGGMAARRPPAARGNELGAAERVVVMGVPGLTFGDLLAGPMPALRSLADHGGTAAMTARLAAKAPTTADLYASIGAGSEAATPAGFGATEPTGGVSVRVNDAAGARAKNRRAHRSSLPGALGDALARRRVGAAAIGNSDGPGPAPGAGDRYRPVAAAVMQSSGAVPYAVVEQRPLLNDDPSAPSGLRADPDLIANQVIIALTTQSVVFVDTGDMDRLAALRPPATPDVRARHRAAALAGVDATVALLRDHVPAGTLVFVVGLDPGGTRRLTPVVAFGPGVFRGFLSSSSTGRRGVVTLADIAPTILAAVDVPVPKGMVGRPLRSSAAAPNVRSLADIDRDARATERLRGPETDGVVVAIVLFAAFAALTLSRLGRPRRSGPALAWSALVVGAIPIAFLFVGWVRPGPLAGWAGLGLAAIAVLFAVIARASHARAVDAFLDIEAATLIMLLIDVCTGSRLQNSTALGSSLLVAARFRGIGNAGLGVVAAATVLVGVWLVQPARSLRPVVAGLFAVVVLVVCLPFLGAKVGGIFVLVPVLAAVGAALAGRRLSWRITALCVAAVVVVLAGAVAVDAARPARSRSHLGRLVGSTADGTTSFGTIVSRKVSSAVHVTRTSHWMPAAVALAALLVLLLWRCEGWRRLGTRGSLPHVAVAGVVAAAVLGLVTSDSGILTAALALTAVAVYVVLELLETVPHEDPQPPP